MTCIAIKFFVNILFSFFFLWTKNGLTCSVCMKSVSNSCSSTFCSNCNLWVHQSHCFSLSLSEFETFSQPNSKSWFCPKCLNSTLPFFFSTWKPEKAKNCACCRLITVKFLKPILNWQNATTTNIRTSTIYPYVQL